MSAVRRFIKRETVLSISFVLAVLSVAIVPVDSTYLSYMDFRTLAILFCLMVVVSGLRRLMIFDQVGELLLGRVGSVRGLSLVMILLCFFFSMLITNDVALITFVPFAIVTLNMAGRTEAMIPVIVLETVAANLGSMMTPMGNPQNLYLYSKAGLSFVELLRLMLPYGVLSLLLIVLLAFVMIGRDSISGKEKSSYRRRDKDKVKIAVYAMLFAMEILVVMRVIDYRAALLVLLGTVFIMDRRMLIFGVDYSLLMTFVCLFIFIGNLKRMPELSMALAAIVSGNEIITAAAASQVISNVPAAILLSAFTDNISGLIIGTNLGGLGTLIASMASLISFKQYSCTRGANKRQYIKEFTIINAGLLAVLLVFAMII